MHDSFLRGIPSGIPWRRFREFISPQANRFTILNELLTEAKLDYSVFDITGNRHFIAADGQYPPVILVAHYDRAPGSPGANDNSTGVFLLLETAIKLKSGKIKDWMIIFTDKEELKTGESIQTQGAYALAMSLKNSAVKKSKVFSFDSCGTGDTLVISTTADYLLKKEGGGKKLRDSVMELRKLALDTARNLSMAKVLLAPTPFSDDAGFFRAGLAAQAITMLPTAECARLSTELRKNPDFADALISAERQKNNRDKFIPETWRYLNGPGDSYLRLTPEHFHTVVRFAEALVRG